MKLPIEDTSMKICFLKMIFHFDPIIETMFKQ